MWLECYDENDDMYLAPGWMSVSPCGTDVRLSELTEVEAAWSATAADMYASARDRARPS